MQIALCDSHGHGPNLSGDARTDWFSMHAPLFDAHPRGSERALAATRGRRLPPSPAGPGVTARSSPRRSRMRREYG